MFVFSKILTLFLIKAFKYKIQVYKTNNTNPVTKSTETNKFKIRVF